MRMLLKANLVRLPKKLKTMTVKDFVEQHGPLPIASSSSSESADAATTSGDALPPMQSARKPLRGLCVCVRVRARVSAQWCCCRCEVWGPSLTWWG